MSQNELSIKDHPQGHPVDDPPYDNDLRVRRTRKLLCSAFIDLVVEVGFNAITVQLLAERAMVNRATFYRHYQDKFDLAEKVYAAITAEYHAALVAVAQDTPLRGWELLFQHIASYAEFYLAILSDMPHFREHICQNIEQELHAGFLQMGFDAEKSALPPALALRYLATAQMGIIQWWLEAGQPVSAAQMASYLMQLHTHGAIQPLHLPVSVWRAGHGQ